MSLRGARIWQRCGSGMEEVAPRKWSSVLESWRPRWRRRWRCGGGVGGGLEEEEEEKKEEEVQRLLAELQRVACGSRGTHRRPGQPSLMLGWTDCQCRAHRMRRERPRDAARNAAPSYERLRPRNIACGAPG